MSKTITIYVPEKKSELLTWVKKKARQEERSVSHVVLEAVKLYVESAGGKAAWLQSSGD